jgi:hypothetical protein
MVKEAPIPSLHRPNRATRLKGEGRGYDARLQHSAVPLQGVRHMGYDKRGTTRCPGNTFEVNDVAQ